MPRIISLLVFVLASAAPVCGQASAPEPLRLRPGDAVRLQVADEPALSGDYAITDQGTALLPLIGFIPVAGRPFPEVRAEIEAGYARELLARSVLVTPVLRIAVLGEVRQPGLVAVDPTFTMAEALAAAGGLTPIADRTRVMLLRGDEAVRLSLDEPGGLLTQPLQAGDRIVVARHNWARENLGVLLGAGASVVAAALTSLILR